MTNGNSAPELGSITFIQNYLPPLDAGTYQITVEQQITVNQGSDPGPAVTIDESYSQTRNFAVWGERFVLDPNGISAVFPPANGTGEYSNVLPHVVFTRRTLPWERTLTPQADPNNASWLALLLFDAADPPPTLQSLHLSDLTNLPSGVISYPDFQPGYGETSTDPCQVIDVPLPLFTALVPSAADLTWLAHARTVSLANKAGVQQPPSADFSVVVGNRLPTPNSRCVVHLVSLEGMATYLPTGADYTPANIQASYVRLVSLQNWSFTSVDPTQTFTGYLEHLSTGPLQINPPAPATTDVERAVVNALSLGYTAINHQTRQGDLTVSWYRGPFVPFAVPETIFVPVPDPSADPPVLPISSADQAVRYNPVSGMLDVSYAAAWQLGQLLALQNQTFSVALYNWKRANQQQTILAVEQAIIEESMGDILAPTLLATRESEAVYRPPGAFLSAPHVYRAAIDFLASRLKPHLAQPQARPAHTVANRGRMKLLQPRRAHFQRLAALATSPASVAAILAGSSVPDSIGQWLGQLKMLSGVPFNYLVPDVQMLPEESIRFFQVDLNWIYCLLEGAFSIGRASTADQALDAAVAPNIHAASTTAARQIRARGPQDTSPLEHVTGFLLRSAVVAGWPSLEVTAYDAGNNLLSPVLRMEQLAPTILLFMVEGVIDHVDIHEPSEGVHFGLDAMADVTQPPTCKQLRYISVPAGMNAQPGCLIDGVSVAMSTLYRSDRVLMIDSLAQQIQRQLQAAQAISGDFTAAEFALEMVEGVQGVTFQQGVQPSVPG